MNVCYITDNDYVQHTMVSMASLLTNKFPTSKWDVYVVCDNVDSEKKKMLRCFDQEGFRVVLVDHKNTFTKKDSEFGKYISASTYIRLNLPSMFPKMNKLLYLDGDIIITGDLSELYGLDISGYAMAGSIDYGMCITSTTWDKVEYIRKTLPNYEREYINAGVLLMNLSELRRIGFEKSCQKLYNERTDFIFADQDIINFALIGRKKILPIYWNCPILSFHMNYANNTDEFLKKRIAEIYHITYRSIMDIAFKSRVIHINGNKRYIQDIPYLKEMYAKYLELAMAYMKGGTK